MELYGNSAVHDICVDDSNAEAVAEFDKITREVTDDPTLRVENLAPEDAEKIRLHFVGWSHDQAYSALFADALVDFKPDVVIEECLGPRERWQKGLDVFVNLQLRGQKAYCIDTDTKRYAELPTRVTNSDHSFAHAYEVAGDALGQPTIRAMDATLEAIPEAFRPILEPGKHHETQLRAGALSWTHTFEQLKTLLRADEELNAAFIDFRDAHMIADISRIAANAAVKADDKVNILVGHGSFHTRLYQYFRRTCPDLDVTRQFLQEKYQKVEGSYVFPASHILGRIATQTAGGIKDGDIEFLLVDAVLQDKVVNAIRETPLGRLPRRQTLHAITGSSNYLRDHPDEYSEALDAWKSVRPKVFKKELKGVDAVHETLMNSARSLVAEVLEKDPIKFSSDS
jgi:hypothetical protein